MEATEKSVSREEEDFPADIEKVLDGITKSSYPTADQLIKETGLSVGRVSRALKHLEKSNLVKRRVDELLGVLYKLVPLEVKIPKTHETVAAAALKSKVKQLYEDGLIYDEISEQLNIPRGTVSTIISRLVAKNEMKARGKGTWRKITAA
jgi:DNA-binding MarR family transcriptional regulator